MRFWYLFALLIVELLFWIQTAHAASPVISEVMWPGSDLSSSDEWFEITLPVCSPGDAACSDAAFDLGAWTVTYLKGTGQEAVMVTFPSGFVVQPGQYLVISRFAADNSRLLVEPALVSSAVTLLNSGLNLKLKDPGGTIIDEVDDGVGAPFAGANPSAPGAKASMERVDPKVAGTIKENWRTAKTSRGLDSGANMLATPGFENGSSVSASSSSASTSSSSQSSSSSSSLSSTLSSSESSVSSVSSVSSPSSQSSASSCSSDLVPTIILQSGSWTGVGKVTLNVQATAAHGTMAGAVCRFDFGDGYVKNSCNPGVHTYDHPGIFTLALEVKNQCGNTLTQSRTVEVTPSPSARSSSVSGSPEPFDGARLLISGVLPNPDAKDKDKEWIEIKNPEDRPVSVAGWHLATGVKKVRRFVIDAVTQIPPHGTVRLYQIESGIELTNASGRVQLINPLGSIVSSVAWSKAEEGRVFLSDSFKDGSLKGTVARMMDPVTFDVSLDGPSSNLVGQESVRVKLLGVQLFHSGGDSKLLLHENKTLEFVRALIENKKVELLFDSDVWTSNGVLQVYLLTDQGASLQKQMLLSGFVSADTSSLYTARQEYLDAQKQAIATKAGFWSLGILQKVAKTYGALTEDKKIASILETVYAEAGTNSGRILITEVFSSPLAQVAKEEPDSLLGSEWLEFFNPGSDSLSLRGWTLSIGKKTITFGPSSIVEGGKHVIVLAHQLGLKLKNAGDSIELKSPSKMLVASVEYPKLKNGQSYIFDERTESYCMSKSPSAGQSGFCQNSVIKSAPAAVVSAKKTTASRSKAKPKTARKSVYDTYAQNYKQGLRHSEQSDIVIGSPETGSSSPSGLMLVVGILLGSLASFGLLKVPAIRRWLEV